MHPCLVCILPFTQLIWLNALWHCHSTPLYIFKKIASPAATTRRHTCQCHKMQLEQQVCIFLLCQSPGVIILSYLLWVLCFAGYFGHLFSLTSTFHSTLQIAQRDVKFHSKINGQLLQSLNCLGACSAWLQPAKTSATHPLVKTLLYMLCRPAGPGHLHACMLVTYSSAMLRLWIL